jgi:large subunit ribosomal protein L9
MKVLFLKHVINVWKPWEIKEVKTGFAVNMLIPKWLAIELTPKAEAKHNEKLKKDEKYRMSLIEWRHEITTELNWKTLELTLKTDNTWKVFGGIWEKNIIDVIKQRFNLKLSKKHIDMPDWHLKKVGEHIIYIKFWKDSIAKMIVRIEAEKLKVKS